MIAKKSKKFDTVKMMRKIRDELSREIMNMDFEEQKRFIRKSLKKA